MVAKAGEASIGGGGRGGVSSIRAPLTTIVGSHGPSGRSAFKE